MGTPFTTVGIEIQPGAHTYYDLEYTKRFVNSITEMGLDVYIWEFWILSAAVIDMDANESSIYPRNAPPEGYSEEWQAMVLKDMLDFINVNGRIIGMNYMCNIFEGSFNPSYMTGLIRSDGTQKPSYQVFLDWVEQYNEQN